MSTYQESDVEKILDSARSIEDSVKSIESGATGWVGVHDQFALAAMRVFLDPEDANINFPEIAKDAWAMADAMMVERKKRGLGGMGATDGASKD